MKSLRKIQLLAVSACLVVGMSSCLKNSEPDFAAGLSGYIIQKNDAGNTRFQPYFFAQTNNPATVTLRSSDNYESYPLADISLDQSYFVSNNKSYMYPAPTDSIPSGNFTLEATNAGGEVVRATMAFTVTSANKLGAVNVKEFTYSASSKLITAKWKKTTNAKEYYLVVVDSRSPFRNLNQITGSDTTGTLNVSANLTNGDQYTIYVGAANGSIIADSEAFQITIGTDYTVKKEE